MDNYKSLDDLDDSFINAPISAISHPLNLLTGVENVVDRNNIKILTYNIFLRPPGVKNNASDHKDERLKGFIKILKDFDIICLQEMFGFLNKRKHKLIRCATKAGFLFYADSSSPSFFTSFVVDGGLLVLSRFPLLASEFKPYPYGIFSDSLAQKGVLYTKIQVKDEILHMFCTHTQASYFGENQRYPILTRADQFTTFRNFIVSTLKKYSYKDGEVILLMGDFNVDSRKPYIETNKVLNYPGFKEYEHLKAHEFFNEYDAMMCYLSDNFKDDIQDLLHDKYGEHPITYADSVLDGDNQLKPSEIVLTHKDDYCSNQSLDYIFKLSPKTLFTKHDNSDLEEGQGFVRQRKLKVVPDSAKVEKFLVAGRDFTQLSDHYGASVTLEYDKNANPRQGEKTPKERSSQIQASFDQIISLE